LLKFQLRLEYLRQGIKVAANVSPAAAQLTPPKKAGEESGLGFGFGAAAIRVHLNTSQLSLLAGKKCVAQLRVE